jgi:predicted transcriptional regulator
MLLLSEVRDLLDCEVFVGQDRMGEVQIRFGAGAVLLTGLVNIQTVQTAFIAEISAIVFVRGKHPAGDVIALATEKEIPLLGTPFSMYEACGLLYGKGLCSTMERVASGGQHAGR